MLAGIGANKEQAVFGTLMCCSSLEQSTTKHRCEECGFCPCRNCSTERGKRCCDDLEAWRKVEFIVFRKGGKMGWDRAF